MDMMQSTPCLRSEWKLRLKNVSASLFILSVVYWFYCSVPYYQLYASTELQLFSFHRYTREVLPILYGVYAILLLLYYVSEKQPQIAKSVYCLLALRKIIQTPFRVYTEGLNPEERLGILSILLKVFFAPLMVAWLLDHIVHMLNNGIYIFNHPGLLTSEFLFVFNSHGFWFLFQLILFLDVLFFTLGYLMELPSLNNTIRSIDPTLLGWSIALICYPPFNGVTNRILSWQPTDFPQYDNPTVHIVTNLFLLLLMAVYTSASVALNFKASNLTHRGIIASGPYRFIRHPAYVCKNLAWWIASLPAINAGIQNSSAWSVLLVLASVAGWTLIYVLRALTEEDHLRKVDNEYDKYCEKVRYRFMPGVL
jgi:protein-S-isoprenylcysteine O-methyltransferase Ste14